MAKLVLVFEDTENYEDYRFGVQFLNQNEEEEEHQSLTKAGMAAFLTGYIVQQGYLEDFKDEFIKFTRDASNEIHLNNKKDNGENDDNQ